MGTEKHGIILNRMYDGNYLKKNLGHEIINLFTTDQGKHYIYLNSDGKLPQNLEKDIIYDQMLLIKRHCEGIIEIVGKATGLKSKYKKDENQNKSDIIKKITYGKVDIPQIFKNDQYQDVLVTYKAKHVYRPEKRMFIFLPSTKNQITGEESIKGHVQNEQEYIRNKGYKIAQLSLTVQALQAHRQYVKQTDDPADDYHMLLNTFFNDNTDWEELGEKHKINLEKIDNQEDKIVTLFDICKIQDSELCFSNALGYFMMQYQDLWIKFFQNLHTEEGKYIGVTLKKCYELKREEHALVNDNNYRLDTGGYIDLSIRDDDHLILIENKIKSDINTIERDKRPGIQQTTQLDRYWNYAIWQAQHNKPKANDGDKDYDKNKYPDWGKKEENIKAYVLAPNYNIPDISAEQQKHWEIITYFQVYDFLKEHKSEFENDINFVHFVEAMYRHTYKNVNDYLYYEMQEKFFNRIKQLKK